MKINFIGGGLVKKYVLLLAALMLIFSSLVSCDMINDGFKNKNATAGEKSKTEIKNDSGALISCVSSSATSLSVKIENNTDSTWQSGNMRDYTLEVMQNGEWHLVNQIGEFANTMELMIFAPGETLTHTFEFEGRYGILGAGKYRIVKSFWANKTANEDAHEFHLVCEFTVE